MTSAGTGRYTSVWWRRTGAAVAAGALLLSAGCADDDGDGPGDADEVYELTFASWIGTNNAQGRSIEWWMDEITQRSGGRITFEAHWASALLPPEEILTGTAQGRADIGHMTIAYNPAELPLSQVAGIPFETANIAAEAATFTELYQEYEPYQEEWTRNGVEVLLFYGVPSNVVGAKEPIPSLDWFDGKKMRGLGLFNEALQAAGANPVGLPVNEVYEALERGVVEGFTGTILEILPDQGWAEVAPYVYEMKMGSPTFNQIVVNPSVWEDLPADLQKIVQDVSAEFADVMIDAYAEGADISCQTLRDAGATLDVLPDSEIQRWRQAIGSSISDKWQNDTAASGAPAAEFYQRYLQTLQRFEQEHAGYELDMVRCAQQAG